MVPNSSVEETRNISHLKTSGAGQMSVLTHSLAGMDLGSGLSATENESQVNSGPSHLQPVTPNSTLMTLASLISMNPALASLSLPYTGQNMGNTTGSDFASTASAISPGFLAALAQYLNVQPHVSGHQSVSPMQQLAETAQLAAQLAAMVGAHSPDQTPMQPAQALALAQLVMSQATSLSEQSWASLSKRDATTAEHTPDSSVVDSVNRRVEKNTSDELSRNRGHIVQDSVGVGATGDDSRSEIQSVWSAGFGTNNAGSVVSPRAADGRAVTKGISDAQMNCDADRTRDCTVRTSGSTVAAFSTPRSQAKGQSKAATQRPTANLSSGKCQNGLIPGSTRDVHATTGVPEGSNSIPSTMNTNTPNANWRWPAGSTLPDSMKKTDQLGAVDRDPGQKSSPSAKQLANQWVNKVKQTPVKSNAAVSARGASGNGDTRINTSSQQSSGKGVNKVIASQAKPAAQTSPANGNIRSPLKSSGTTPTNPNKSVHVVSTTASPQLSVSYQATTIALDPDRTAEHELEQLIQWCQTRLSSFPMREKVDIPTVVELLATLDAPYEVERMVQTFLGESARTSQFVKDFLDHRRPFWQLHRERRERESQVKSSSKSQSGSSHVQSNGPRSGDKKKRTTHAQDNTGRITSTSGCNGGLAWHMVGSSNQGNHTDPTQDNEVSS
ncbi:unnamed protein product [Echinostoma caproni]|uniref:POU domain protein n=1 Tax=Echinostoma caproni TaxID=27848 RepID=A0A183B2Z3_9TREM|nr:unnamed protein product [Echinostoma caproni]